MGLFDDIDNEVLGTSYNNANNISYAGGLFDDIDAEIEEQELKRQQESGFANKHPFVASIPESLKQFGLRAVKSYPEFGKGLNDLFALIGDKADLPGLSSFGKGNAEFWERQSNKIQIDPRYQGLQGLKSKETFIPTVLGEIGGQATNIALSGGGAGAGAKVAGSIGAKGLAKAGLTGLGTALPNLAQEGQYLDKIQQFEAINGRLPNEEELQKIQNVALTEKGVNSALETVADVALFGKLFPQGTASKGVKNILKNAGQQFVTEAGTEGMQEGVSIGAEKLLGINQGNNLERLAESMAIGGLVGGAIGGGATAISQPYDINFPQGEAPEIAKTIYENSKKTAQDLSNYAKDVSAEIVNRINPNNYETTIEMVPQETGVGLSQRTEYVPQVKKVYRNPNLQANQEVNVTPETQVNYQDNVGNLPSNLPVNNQNLTNFIMGESGNLNTIAPKTMAKQKAKVNNPLQLTDNLYVDKKAVDTFIKDIDNIKYNKTEGNSKPSTKSSEDLSKNTNVQEKISKIAPKTAEKQNNKKEVETETIEEQIAKLEKKSQKVGGEKTKLGQKYLKQAQELRNSLKTKNANKNIDDTKGLSSEQQKQLEELNQQYEKTKANLTKEQKLSGSAYSDMQSKLKGLAMEYSAKKRQIIQGDRLEYIEGGLTTKELEAKKKQLESNYVGKKVYVNNEEAEIVGHSFGKPRVKFANGEIKTVNKEDVKNERQISTYGVVNPHKALSIIAPKTVGLPTT